MVLFGETLGCFTAICYFMAVLNPIFKQIYRKWIFPLPKESILRLFRRYYSCTPRAYRALPAPRRPAAALSRCGRADIPESV